MKHMSLKEITAACHGSYYGDESLLAKEVQGVVIDSRQIEADYLFIPIRGMRVDGHKFIPQVMENGALCTLSEEVLPDAAYPYIVVESCTQALKDLAEHYRSHLDIKVVGITGSVGKTSTKEMVASVLEQKYQVLKTDGNFNNEIGLPLTIFRIREHHEVAVLEMGINHFGEMSRLAKIAKPDICVITNIGFCHLEFLIDRAGVLKAKTEVFDYLTDNASVILNGDDDMLATVENVQGKKPYFFGLNKAVDLYADDIRGLGLAGTSCIIHNGKESFEAAISIPGNHMVYNALAGAAVGYALGLTSEEIKNGIEALVPVSGRNNLIQTENFTIIDDCYNANPVSMKASLEVLADAEGRKVAILGDMGELGKDENQLHFEVGVHAAELNIDTICCVGPHAKYIADGARSIEEGYSRILHFPTREEMLASLDTIVMKNDTILVKSSHMMEFSVVVEYLKMYHPKY